MRNGFTLLEILIVISITIMISALAISYTSSTQQQIGLYVEVQKLSALILRAKSLAVSTYNDPQAAGASNVVICGYGIAINYPSNRYSLFFYKVPPGQNCGNITTIKHDPDGAPPEGPTEIELLSSHDVAPGVILLDENHRDSDGNRDSIYYVLFVPPSPITLISISFNGDVLSPPGPGSISLITKDASLNATISVSSVGQVDF